LPASLCSSNDFEIGSSLPWFLEQRADEVIE
jgi:hypothetical protein